MSQELKQQLAEIKPGHPIWDEVWAKSRPDGTSHLNQLFEAKLKLAQLERTNAALLGALKPLIRVIENLYPDQLIRDASADNEDEFRAVFNALRIARTALAEAESQKENGNG